MTEEPFGESVSRSPVVIDARGLSCPMPLLKARQVLNTSAVGALIEVWASDENSVRDFHAFIRLTSHSLLSYKNTHEGYIYVIRKGH